jgi:hypothetical protein
VPDPKPIMDYKRLRQIALSVPRPQHYEVVMRS